MTAYQGDPLNIGRSRTINISGARRRATRFLWLITSPTLIILLSVKAVIFPAPFLLIFLKLVDLLSPILNKLVKSLTLTSGPSNPLPVSLERLLD